MRRVGTWSTAAGFIFLGIWMIVSKNNQPLADAMLKWWPLIIILLGIEVLVSHSRNEEGQRFGVNLFIIPVIIIFLGVNIWDGNSYHLSDFNNGNWFTFAKFKNFSNNLNLGINNYRVIDASKTLEAGNKSFSYKTDSGVVRIYKSADNKIKLVSKVYVDNSSSVKNYNINAVANGDADGYSVEMNEDYIKRVDTDLYIPDSGLLKLNTNSSNIEGKDIFNNLSYKIDTDSGNIALIGGTQLVLNIDSGNIKLKDIKEVQVKGSSGTISVNGLTEVINTELDSGTINIDNNVCKDVQVNLNSGMVNVNTKDRNVNVNTSLDSGLCIINGEHHANGGINKIIGSGTDRVNIKLDSGTIRFSSQE